MTVIDTTSIATTAIRLPESSVASWVSSGCAAPGR